MTAGRRYPDELTAPFRLRDGTDVTVRAIRPDDEPLIVALHAAHSERTIRMRFFGMVKLLSRENLHRLCRLDYEREMALVAEHHDADGKPHLLGVSRYHLQPGTGEAEFAVVVSDAWQGQGLGRHLVRRLIDAARERGVRRFVGLVLRENGPMLRLVLELGFAVRPTAEDGVVEAVLDLAAAREGSGAPR